MKSKTLVSKQSSFGPGKNALMNEIDVSLDVFVSLTRFFEEEASFS